MDARKKPTKSAAQGRNSATRNSATRNSATHNSGKCGFPKGAFELKESAQACAERELQEETGYSIDLGDGPHKTLDGRVSHRVAQVEHGNGNFTFMVELIDQSALVKVCDPGIVPDHELVWQDWVDLGVVSNIDNITVQDCPNGTNQRFKESLKAFNTWMKRGRPMNNDAVTSQSKKQ